MKTKEPTGCRAEPIQLVRKVSAGDKHRPAAQGLHRLSDALAQPVVVQRRKSGQADAEDGAVHSSLL